MKLLFILVAVATLALCFTASPKMSIAQPAATSIIEALEEPDRPWSTAVKAKVAGLSVATLTNAYILALAGYSALASNETEMSSAVTAYLLGTVSEVLCTAKALSRPHPFAALTRASAAYLAVKSALLYLVLTSGSNGLAINMAVRMAALESGSGLFIAALLGFGAVLYEAVTKAFH